MESRFNNEQMKKAREIAYRTEYERKHKELSAIEDSRLQDYEDILQLLADQQAEPAPTQDNSPKKHAKYVDKFRERGFKRINNPYNKPTQDSGEWEEELKDFEMIIEDGVLKGCLVYHEAVKDFIRSLLADQQAKHEAELRRAREAITTSAVSLENETNGTKHEARVFIDPILAAFDEAVKVKK